MKDIASLNKCAALGKLDHFIDKYLAKILLVAS